MLGSITQTNVSIFINRRKGGLEDFLNFYWVSGREGGGKERKAHGTEQKWTSTMITDTAGDYIISFG